MLNLIGVTTSEPDFLIAFLQKNCDMILHSALSINFITSSGVPHPFHIPYFVIFVRIQGVSSIKHEDRPWLAAAAGLHSVARKLYEACNCR